MTKIYFLYYQLVKVVLIFRGFTDQINYMYMYTVLCIALIWTVPCNTCEPSVCASSYTLGRVFATVTRNMFRLCSLVERFRDFGWLEWRHCSDQNRTKVLSRLLKVFQDGGKVNKRNLMQYWEKWACNAFFWTYIVSLNNFEQNQATFISNFA